MSLVWGDVAPGVGEYIELRREAGLDPRGATAAAAGLDGGLHAVTVRARTRLIGMGRVVGDDGTVAILVDIAVAPGWRRQGIGGEIVTRLTGWCRAELPASCHVCLIADPGCFSLYRRAGFEIRTGMTLVGS